MYATQIFQKAASQIPGLEAKIAAGDFAPLKAWLNAHIHAAGSLHASGDELMVAATGSALDPTIFLTCVFLLAPPPPTRRGRSAARRAHTPPPRPASPLHKRTNERATGT